MILIYGASDDLVEIEGDVREEIGCYGKSVTIEVGNRDAGGLVVRMRYAPKHTTEAVWVAEVRQFAEGVPVPWQVRIRHTHRGHLGSVGSAAGYSVVVEIDCPTGTPVTRGGRSLRREG